VHNSTPMIRFLLRHLGLLLLTCGAVVVLGGCSGLFVQPRKGLYENSRVQKFAPRDVSFASSDGFTLHGWFLAAREPQGTILFLHGNAENLSTHVNGVLWLVKEGFNVFIVDYRGYGRSEGEATLDGIHQDGAAALERLFSLPGVDPERVALLGQSLGGAVALHTVATSPLKGKIKAVIVESTFSGYRLIAREKLGSFFLTWPFQYPLSWLFDDSYSPVRWIARVAPVPVLILQGAQDPIVPPRHGQLLYEAALPPRELWETAPAGHISSFADPAVRARLISYLRERFSHSR